MLKWMRRRMRKLLWVVAIIAAVTFGATYTMMTVIESALQKHEFVYIFGEKMRDEEIAHERGMLRIERMISGQPTTLEEEELWKEIALLKEADRLGLVVPQSKVDERVMEWYKWHKLDEKMWNLTKNKTREEHRKMWENFYRKPQIEQLQEFKRIEDEFTEADFARLLEKAYENITPRIFREATARMLLKNMLLETVYEDTEIPVNDIYADFLEKYHKRKFQILYLRASDFRETVVPSEDALRTLYEELKEDYRHPERFSFNYILLTFEDVGKTIPEPDEKTLKKFYDRIKWQPPIRRPASERKADEKAFKPLEEVKEYVIKKWKEKEAREKAHNRLSELLKRLSGKSDTEIEQILKEEELTLKRTEPASEEEFVEKNGEVFGKTPIYISKMFDRLKQKKEDVKKRFSGPLRCDRGYFIWRLAESFPSRPKEFEEIRDRVEERYRIKESEKIAERVAKGITLEVRARGDVMEEVALNRHLVLIETDFLDSPENHGRIEGVRNAARILRAGFNTEGENALKEVGDVAGPIRVQSGGDWFFYIIRYADRKDPDTDDFLDRYYHLRILAVRERWEKIREEWEKDLMKRANITNEKGESIFKKPVKIEEPKEEDMFPKGKDEL